MKLLNMVGRHPWIVTVLLLLFAWWWVAEQGWVGPTLLASPDEVLAKLRQAADSTGSSYGAIYSHGKATAWRAFEGWAIALVFGTVLGVLVGTKRLTYSASEPIFEFNRAIPPILAFPLLLVAFDYGEPAYAWTIVFGCLPIMVLAVARGNQGVDIERLELLRIHQPNGVVRILASAMELLPSAFLGARVTFSISLVVAVVSEMVFTPRSGFGIGALAKDAEISFDTATFYACVVLVGAYGFLCNLGLNAVEKWAGGNDGGTTSE